MIAEEAIVTKTNWLFIANKYKSAAQAIILPLVGVVLALFIAGIFIAIAGISPFKAYEALFIGSLGNMFNLGLTLNKMVPLLIIGVGIAVAFRTSLWNIGAEGQMFMGALFGTIVGIYAGGIPLLSILIAMVAGFIGGAIWGVIPALLRVYNISEVITTIMLNYVAIYITGYMVSGPLQDTNILFPQSLPLGQFARLPVFWKGTTAHIGLLVGILVVAGVHLFIHNTTFGFRLDAVGKSMNASRFAGIKVESTIILSMIVSGGLAGLAGIIEISGVYRMLTDVFSPGYGYLAIAVALVGRSEPVAIIISAFIFAILLTGANAMQSAVGVSSSIIYLVQGLTVLFILAGIAMPHFVSSRRKKHNGMA